jgi:hypothetical protein
MRPSTVRLWGVARSAAALAALFALIGCDDKSKGPGGTSDPTTGVAAGQTPMEATDTFLKALGEGKVKPAQLTVNFKKQIAPPATEAEKLIGYSDGRAQEWLDGFRDTKFVVSDTAQFGEAVAVRGRAEAANRREAFALRLVGTPSKDGATYHLDWLHRSERMGSEIKLTTDPDLAAAQDVVRNFLDVLLGGDLRQAHALMTSTWKKSIAPPTPADARDGLDYSPGFLTQTTRAWKRDFTGYSLPKADFTPEQGRSAATFTAVFQTSGQSVPYTVRAVKDKATGWWLVEAFEKQ